MLFTLKQIKRSKKYAFHAKKKEEINIKYIKNKILFRLYSDMQLG